MKQRSIKGTCRFVSCFVGGTPGLVHGDILPDTRIQVPGEIYLEK